MFSASEPPQTQAVSSPLGLLFTDASGQVVFVDRHFLHHLQISESGVVVGEPLHKALGIEYATAKQMLQDIIRAGHLYEYPLEIRTPDGKVLSVKCTGVATFNEHGNFIGADITLYEAVETTNQLPQPTSHQDTLITHIQQVQAVSPQPESVLAAYVTVHFNALQVLLARLAGPRVRKTLDNLLLRKIEQEHWPVQLQNGHLTFAENASYDLFRAVLAETSAYVSGVIGRRLVVREMQLVDDHMDASSLQIAAEFGLRGLP